MCTNVLTQHSKCWFKDRACPLDDLYTDSTSQKDKTVILLELFQGSILKISNYQRQKLDNVFDDLHFLPLFYENWSAAQREAGVVTSLLFKMQRVTLVFNQVNTIFTIGGKYKCSFKRRRSLHSRRLEESVLPPTHLKVVLPTRNYYTHSL